MTWRDAASVRIKLKVPATQRHHRERAARAQWLAISKVRFLYGLPTYNKYERIIQKYATAAAHDGTVCPVGRRLDCKNEDPCKKTPIFLEFGINF